jgi:hypothetical protein
MHVAAALAAALVAFFLVVVVMGITPFVGMPLAVVICLGPIAWLALASRKAAGRRRLEKSGVPTTQEATYEPVIDPSDRP